MTNIPGGTKANKTGTVLERFVLARFADQNYIYVTRQQFAPACFLDQSVYTNKFQVGLSIYGTKQNCDFIVYHPQKWPKRLIIECKWQQSGGSVDEKYPYLVLNIQKQYTCPTIVILDGSGYKKGGAKWLRDQAGHGNLLHVFNMPEFAAWVNNGNL